MTISRIVKSAPGAPFYGWLTPPKVDVMADFNTNTENNDEWITPKYITDCLGPFDLDPCSPGDRRPWDTAIDHYSLPLDGLKLDWFGRVWCNPPYGRQTFKWLEKLAKHEKGVALIFARTETLGFHDYIWNVADSVFFFKRRLKFCNIEGVPQGQCNAPSCLVSYSIQDTYIIENEWQKGSIEGRLVKL